MEYLRGQPGKEQLIAGKYPQEPEGDGQRPDALTDAVWLSAVLMNTLGEVLSVSRAQQFRIAETEKYAHVTFFFNGGEERPFPLEDRVLIPSPRDTATYDLKPEMSAWGVTAEVVQRISSREYGFILINYANPDMVGHTGVLTAAVKAVEVLNECLTKVIEAALRNDTRVLITSDHGNLEIMRDDKTGQTHTAHTTDPVPLIVIEKRCSPGRRMPRRCCSYGAAAHGYRATTRDDRQEPYFIRTGM